jgi:hypothetical protein
LIQLTVVAVLVSYLSPLALSWLFAGAAAPMSRRVSGLQKEVLALYRAVLRAARRKDPQSTEGTVDLVKQQFRADVSRRLMASFWLLTMCRP